MHLGLLFASRANSFPSSEEGFAVPLPLTARPPLNFPALRSQPSERPQGLPRGSSQTELLPGAAPSRPRAPAAQPAPCPPPLTAHPPPAPEAEEAPPSALPLLRHRAGGAWPMAAGSRRG